MYPVPVDRYLHFVLFPFLLLLSDEKIIVNGSHPAQHDFYSVECAVNTNANKKTEMAHSKSKRKNKKK